MTRTAPVVRTRRLRLGLGSAGITLTPEEFDAVPWSACDDRYRYQLIRGVLVVSPIAGICERAASEELGCLLRNYQETNPRGSVLDVTLPGFFVPHTANRRLADRLVWTGLGRLPVLEEDVPSIVADFVSPRRRHWLCDYEEKRAEYLAIGVREYWVIDRFRRTMTVFTPDREGFRSRGVAESETYQTDLLPGFVLPLSRLFARADRWARRQPKHPRRPPPGGTNG